MDEVLEQRVTLPPGRLAELRRGDDRRSVVHAVFTVGAVLLTAPLAVRPGPLQPLWLLLAGLAAGGTFPAFHEALHRTVFRSAVANDAFAWVVGFVQVASPSGYRAFHMHHHRHTHAPEDPEIAFDAERLADWPRNLVELVALLSGQGVLLVKVAAAVAAALLPAGWWGPRLGFVAEADRARVAWECRLVLALHGLALWALGPLWFATLSLGHLVMGPMLFAEHTGLPMEGSVLERTRSLRPTAPLAWFWWNMNLHAEHHGWPAVPWWRLPELSAELGDRVPHRSGYGPVIGEAARRAVRGR